MLVVYVYTDTNYLNYRINNIMDNTNDISQGRPSGGGVQTRSRTASGTRRTARAKRATPQGPQGSRTPVSTAKIARSMVADAEATGAAGKAAPKDHRTGVPGQWESICAGHAGTVGVAVSHGRQSV